MVDSLYYSSRKISERCENSFLDYRINYQKALLFNEANHERFELTHWVILVHQPKYFIIMVMILLHYIQRYGTHTYTPPPPIKQFKEDYL